MSLQPLFRRFHEAIQLRNHEESAELRQKRENILARLREKLHPRTFTWFNQGSYEMGTGVKSIHRDYDIDIGLVFELDPQKNPAGPLKAAVYQALQGYTPKVEWQFPCITVHYRQAGEFWCHADLAVLSKDSNGTLRLAVGEVHAPAEQQWRVDDRQGFIKDFNNKFTGEDEGQLRRVIRYLKRWKDVHFPSQGRAAPTGLSLTVAAHHWFRPVKRSTPQGVEYDDLTAATNLVAAIYRNFNTVFDARLQKSFPRLTLKFPRAPHDDVLERMTNQQMFEFHLRLDKLSGWLDEAKRAQSAAPLQRAFGPEFPLK